MLIDIDLVILAMIFAIIACVLVYVIPCLLDSGYIFTFKYGVTYSDIYDVYDTVNYIHKVDKGWDQGYRMVRDESMSNINYSKPYIVTRYLGSEIEREVYVIPYLNWVKYDHSFYSSVGKLTSTLYVAIDISTIDGSLLKKDAKKRFLIVSHDNLPYGYHLFSEDEILYINKYAVLFDED